MALTEPLDLLSDFPGWCTSFRLLWRQEQSRHASGRTRVKDFGSPIWTATYVSKELSANTLDHWDGRLTAAEDGMMTFKAWKLSRTRPAAHPGASVLPSGTIHTIGVNNKSIRITGIPNITLSIGDFVQIGVSNLHEIMELRTATAGGLTALGEIRPHLWPGTAVAEPVVIYRPSCLMTVVPGSVSAAADPKTGRGTISWQGVEARG